MKCRSVHAVHPSRHASACTQRLRARLAWLMPQYAAACAIRRQAGQGCACTYCDGAHVGFVAKPGLTSHSGLRISLADCITHRTIPAPRSHSWVPAPLLPVRTDLLQEPARCGPALKVGPHGRPVSGWDSVWVSPRCHFTHACPTIQGCVSPGDLPLSV